MRKLILSLVMFLMFVGTSYAMKWDISGHYENQSTISWQGNHKWINKSKCSVMFIVNGNLVNQLHSFSQSDDEGQSAISRRWHLTITDLPESAWWPNRSVQATFYGQDSPVNSVLDGSTFGEISIWEHNPDNIDEINLVVDFTKVRSQGHEFGVHVMIIHSNKHGQVIASPLSE